MHDMEMQGMHGGMGGWDLIGVIGPLIGFLFVVGLLAMISVAALHFFAIGRGGGRADSAENILRERFARGEISAEEYEKSADVLRDNQTHKSYEDYIRDAMNKLRYGRTTDS